MGEEDKLALWIVLFSDGSTYHPSFTKKKKGNKISVSSNLQT